MYDMYDRDFRINPILEQLFFPKHAVSDVLKWISTHGTEQRKMLGAMNFLFENVSDLNP